MPGLTAKPVIDLALGQPPDYDLSRIGPNLRAMGWTEPVDIGDHRASFQLDGDIRIAIAHLFTHEQWACAHVRLFAAWLRTHDADRDAYQNLKQTLVADGIWGSAYTAAKTSFVVAIVNQARARDALPPVNHL